MSSEAITQNDLREILSRTVGSIPSEYKKLLWTNSSPSSEFGAQTLTPPQVEFPNYSTEEQQVGTWTTGKPLYRKVLQYSSMPNNTTAQYPHNISNIDIVTKFTCCWYDASDGRFLMSPRIDSNSIFVKASIGRTNVIFEAFGTDWSARTNNVNVIVEYTKTTD